MPRAISQPRIAAFVPAKSESTRVPKKNLRILDGEYLFKRKLIQLLDSKLITDVYLDTDSDEIINLANDLPIKILKRDPSLASNKTDGHELFANEAKEAETYDIVVQALCTAPFITTSTVDRMLRLLIQNEDYDSATAVTKTKNYKWTNRGPIYGEHIPNSVDLPDDIFEAMSLYAVRRKHDRDMLTKRIGKKPILFEVSPQEAIDVNTEDELKLSEKICAGERSQWIASLQSVGSLLSSSLIADAASQLGISTMLPHKIKHLSGGKIIGPAKTLSIADKNLTNNAECKDIYSALDSYQFIRHGDVIVVDNKVQDHAYFGDLNASLAIRNGAIGTVVNGFTRDIDNINVMAYTVFGEMSYARDVREKGCVESMNQTIQIGEVKVSNNDIIYGDRDGVCCIPREKINEILELAIMAAQKEHSVKLKALQGIHPRKILSDNGEF